MSEINGFHLECIRCHKPIGFYHKSTMDEVGYTKYSYCEDCLREGLAILKERDKQMKLEKCPFCGGKAVLTTFDEDSDDWSVECTKCRIAIIAPAAEEGCTATKEEAVTAWNRRAKE